MRRRFRAACITLFCLGAGACSWPEADPALRYEHWLHAGHQSEVAAYVEYLRKAQVDGIVPAPALLRSGRRWRRCGFDEFAVPPRTHWPAMTSTLKLVAELQGAGILTQSEVASAWRSRAFNQCEGGSPMSRHLDNNALDFDLAQAADVEALCGYWRRQGRAKRFGLGFYSPRAIHVDTAGFRTWGTDHHRGTSLCERPAPAR